MNPPTIHYLSDISFEPGALSILRNKGEHLKILISPQGEAKV
jgi:hypothetical protein